MASHTVWQEEAAQGCTTHIDVYPHHASLDNSEVHDGASQQYVASPCTVPGPTGKQPARQRTHLESVPWLEVVTQFVDVVLGDLMGREAAAGAVWQQAHDETLTLHNVLHHPIIQLTPLQPHTHKHTQLQAVSAASWRGSGWGGVMKFRATAATIEWLMGCTQPPPPVPIHCSIQHPASSVTRCDGLPAHSMSLDIPMLSSS